MVLCGSLAKWNKTRSITWERLSQSDCPYHFHTSPRCTVDFWEPNLPTWTFTGHVTSSQAAAHEGEVSHLTPVRADGTCCEPSLPFLLFPPSHHFPPHSSLLDLSQLHGLPQPLPIIGPLSRFTQGSAPAMPSQGGPPGPPRDGTLPSHPQASWKQRHERDSRASLQKTLSNLVLKEGEDSDIQKWNGKRVEKAFISQEHGSFGVCRQHGGHER